tara:strand:- start:484 stop:918 length:435 start_codon:yes stop_codon:yes gene_type:complete
MAYITGLDGAASFPGYDVKFNTWSATVSRAVLDMTAFGDAGKRRQLGLLDVSGSAGGHMIYDVGSGDGSDPGLKLMAANTNKDGLGSVLLSISSVSTACTIGGKFVIPSIAISSDVNGDATCQLEFSLSGGNSTAFAVAWDESA